jgi:hypothetical protein
MPFLTFRITHDLARTCKFPYCVCVLPTVVPFVTELGPNHTGLLSVQFFKPSPTSGPLHLLSCLSGTLFVANTMADALISLDFT